MQPSPLSLEKAYPLWICGSRSPSVSARINPIPISWFALGNGPRSALGSVSNTSHPRHKMRCSDGDHAASKVCAASNRRYSDMLLSKDLASPSTAGANLLTVRLRSVLVFDHAAVQ
jgi:hypothetical protein